MFEGFEVVTDVAEISRLNKQLAKQLRATLPYKESREISYPAGHHTGTVFFESRTGVGVRAWSPHIAPDKLLNYVLSADPRSPRWIEIIVQLNFPAGTYNRRMAGAFVKDGSGEVFVAHRGKLTKGNAGLPKDKVFREFAGRTVEATDNGNTSRLILIGGLTDPEIANRLWAFAEEAREIATRLGEELHGNGRSERSKALLLDTTASSDSEMSGEERMGDESASRASALAETLLKLRGYFDEYSGVVRVKGHGGGKRTVEHGAVVRALELTLQNQGSSQKAQAIDLAVVTVSNVDLFEVKTTACTADLYTGVGQLVIHGQCLNDVLGLPVERYLVIPEKPKASHGEAASKSADIKIVIYEKKGATYQFMGLP